MVTKATILTAVRDIYPSGIPEDVDPSLDGLLTKAIQQYGRDKPYHDVVDVTGESANLMTTPTGWEDGFSRVLAFVYPYVDEDSTRYENISDYLVVERIPGTPVVEKIRFLALSPSTTETVRVWFTRPHDCSDTACTVYAQDEHAVASLVAAKIESARASKYLGLKDQGVLTDLVDYGTKASTARSLAKAHLSDYRAGIGTADDGNVRAAAVAGEMDTDPQYPYSSYMTHHQRSQR